MIPGLAAWSVGTTLHFVLSARAAARLRGSVNAQLDTHIFDAVLFGVGSLALVLHTVAITIGLGLVSGLAALAMWHAGLAWLVRARAEASPTRHRVTTVLESVAIGVVAGVVLTWVGLSAQSSTINGPDAAHYHVPYAVNLATGASPFDLPATPHVYPMAASMISAWFIVPLGDPLIVDLAMALPFLLMIASLNLLFRCVTGLSGTAWATWLGLVLFTTPMLRSSSEGAADLWFAAAFVAMVGLVVRALSDRRIATVDVALLGLASGLLAGSKATGLPAAALVGVASVLVLLARRWSGAGQIAWPSAAASVAVGLLAFLGAGGIWLVRSWWQFGSPIAPSGLTILGHAIFAGDPFQQTTYFSVLGETQTESFHLWSRTRAWVGEWFGSWFLLLLWPAVILAIDLVVNIRRRDEARWWPRAGLLIVTVLTGAALIWLLIGAPWTALDRSRGLTLRYILPIPALLALLAFTGFFPLTFDWTRQPIARAVGLLGVLGTSALLLATGFHSVSQAASSSAVPGLAWPWLLCGLALASLMRVTSRGGAWRFGPAVGLATLVLVQVPGVVNADLEARNVTEAARDNAEAAFRSGAINPDSWRDVFPAIREAERQRGSLCSSSRFFALIRFDEPLALQPPGFGNQVFYAGRDIEAARRAGPIHTCDYVISSAAMDGTEKGKALAAALAGPQTLRVFASTGDFVVWTGVRLGSDTCLTPV